MRRRSDKSEPYAQSISTTPRAMPAAHAHSICCSAIFGLV
jgi:hypothetical protein